MHLPLGAPAPLVTTHAAACHDLVEHRCPVRHVQPYRTGRLVLPTTRVATSARWVLERADTTTRSRGCSAAPWLEAAVTDRRSTSRLAQTAAQRRPAPHAARLVEDPVCDHGGRRWAAVDRRVGRLEWQIARFVRFLTEGEA